MNAPTTALLPPDIQVLERGWLSANSIVLLSDDNASVIDTGYCSHAEQTVALLAHALQQRPLKHLINTHLHSDHCGGNAALQSAWPGVQTLIPPGDAEAVRHWDETRLSYQATGQNCPRFAMDGVLLPGETRRLGARQWQIHAAPGHDPHAVVLFEPESGILVSGDALWENGFGVVFPELDGANAFDEVAQTLDVIERLPARTVIPGHGKTFNDVPAALARARSRLAQFRAHPEQHLGYALKVLLKFKLLEWQRISPAALHDWAESTAYIQRLYQQTAQGASLADWLETWIHALVRSGAAMREGDEVVNQD